MNLEWLEGRNPVLEALVRQKRRVHRIWMDERTGQGGKIASILAAAQAQGIPVERVSREWLDRKSRGEVHNGVMAEAEPHVRHTINTLLDELYDRGEEPLLVLADEVVYEQNLGAILRSSLGAGVKALVIPVSRGKGLSPVVSRIAMGGAEEVPVVREGISSSLKRIRKDGIRVLGAHQEGRPYWEVDLTGPLALVLGGESKGLSSTLLSKCDEVVGIPLEGGLESLNVSVSAGILLFERIRQQRSREQ